MPRLRHAAPVLTVCALAACGGSSSGTAPAVPDPAALTALRGYDADGTADFYLQDEDEHRALVRVQFFDQPRDRRGTTIAAQLPAHHCLPIVARDAAVTQVLVTTKDLSDAADPFPADQKAVVVVSDSGGDPNATPARARAGIGYAGGASCLGAARTGELAIGSSAVVTVGVTGYFTTEHPAGDPAAWASLYLSVVANYDGNTTCSTADGRPVADHNPCSPRLFPADT